MLRPRLRRPQRGITLLESLVALVIAAVAILGVVGVHLRALVNTQTAVHRAQAVRLTEDLSERMKANPHALSLLADYAHGWGGPTASAPACDSSGCTASQLARRDVTLWWQGVQASLPLGDAATFLVADETDAQGRRQLGVMLSWRENESRLEDESEEAQRAYRAPFLSASTGAAAVECPAGRICHLQYIQPSARCTRSLMAGPTQSQLLCPTAHTP